jgi:integrase
MPGFMAKLHLPFAQWPDADKILWRQLVEVEDPFAPSAGGRLAPASLKRYFMGWRRFLGFLAISEPEALAIAPAERLDPERIKRFAKHLAETCSPGVVASAVEAAYHAARLMMPDADLRWLKNLKTRLYRAAPPKGQTRPAITSLQLLRLGQELMEEVRPKLGLKLALADALRYRDGLMIALTAFAPLRPKNLAALDMVRHLHFAKGACTVVIGKDETKTGTGLEFEIPELLLPDLDAYCRFMRPRLSSDPSCTALWVSAKGGALSYAAIAGIFARHSVQRLGIRLRPHDVRAAAATTWAIFSPEHIEVAQELLAHRNARTTTVHYNRARGIQASREFSKALAKLRTTSRS